MRKVIAGFALCALLSAAACDGGQNSPAPDPDRLISNQILYGDNGDLLLLPNTDPGVATFEAELLRLINDYRLVLGLPALIPSTGLGDAARAHTRNMIEHRFFSHATPEGLTPGERLALANIDWSAVGENIASGYSTPQAVFEAWMASPTHRANIESERFTYAGVGYSLDSNPTPDFPDANYWAMAFLRR